MGTRRMILVDKNSLAAYNSSRLKLINMKEAAYILGVSKKPFPHIMSAGLISPINSLRQRKNGPVLLRRDDVDQLFVCVTRILKKGSGRGKSSGITFRQAVREASFHGINTGDILKQILSGELTVMSLSTNEIGLNKLCIFCEDLRRLIASKESRNNGEFSIPKAAMVMNIKQEVVYELVRSKLLGSKKKKIGAKQKQVVSNEQIELFQKLYISATELASSLNSSSTHIVRVLAKYKIYPATGSTIDGARKYFFLRCAVDKADLSNDFPTRLAA